MNKRNPIPRINFTMRLDRSLNESLLVIAGKEGRERTALVTDAIRFYMQPAEALIRFEMLTDQLMQEKGSELGRVIEGARITLSTFAQSLGSQVLELRQEIKEARALITDYQLLLAQIAKPNSQLTQARPVRQAVSQSAIASEVPR